MGSLGLSGRMMMMKRIQRICGATVLLGLIALGADSVEAAQLNGHGNGVGDQIVVANHSVTPVRVFVEDSEGNQRQLGSVDRGQTTIFEAPAGILERGDFRVVVRPSHYNQFTKDQVSIKTGSLNVEGDETVILWLERELSQSKVEVRAG